jgi:PAS domain S-box-containing protein
MEKTCDTVPGIEAGILDNALVMIAVLGEKGEIVSWNHAAETITGYMQEEVIGRNTVWKDLYPDREYRSIVTMKIATILKTNNYFQNLETTIRTRSGESRTILWNTKTILSGGIKQSIAVGMDITGTREAMMFRESIIDNAHVFITVSDLKGTIRVWNKAAEKISGYTAEEVIGSRDIWEKVYPDPDYRRNVIQKISRIIAGHNHLDTMETTILTKSGEQRDMSWTTRQIEFGGIPHQIRIGLDITDMREAMMFRDSIIDNAYVLITVIGPKGTILVWNKAAEMITGYAHDDVIGRRDIWKKIYPDPEYRRTVTRKISQIIAEHNFFENLETTIITKAGERRDISWNTRQIGFSGIHHEIAIGRDITEQRKAEEALVAYMTEMTMRLKQPIGIIGETLLESAQLIKDGLLTNEEIILMLEGQARNAAQVEVNFGEFQTAIVQKNRRIPEAYRKFLDGE